MNLNPVPDISVVILCYKSGAYARTFYKRVADILKNNGLNYEIVLVGNHYPGSGDETPQIVEELAKMNERTVTVIKAKEGKHCGMGWDLISGLDATSGKTITVIDGDGQIAPEDIPRLYETLKKGNYDLVKGRRISRGDSFYRKFISFVFNTIMQVFFPGIPRDVNGKPKLFTREVYEKLKLESGDWFIDAEIMIKARRLKLKMGEIEPAKPIKTEPNQLKFKVCTQNFRKIQ